MTRRSHRSFVSYIDKSREYYAAQGYDRPYQWAVADNVTLTRPTKPLSQSRVGVVTTTFFAPGTEPEGVPAMTGEGVSRVKRAYSAPIETAPGATFNHDLSWAKDETHTDDIDSYLPLNRLVEAAANAIVGSVAPRFYGVPTGYSQRATVEHDSPQIEQWLREDGVDLAILVAL